MIPTIGRIVHYTLGQQDADVINQRRSDFNAHARANIPEPGVVVSPGAAGRTGHVGHVGNSASAGDVFPATIVRVWGDKPESAVNLQVHLDGNDTFWATSASVGEGPYHYAWPARV